MRVRIAVAIAVTSLLVQPSIASAQTEADVGDGTGSVAEALGLQELPPGDDAEETIVVIEDDGSGGFDVVRYAAPDGVDLDVATSALEQAPSVLSAEPDGHYTLVPPDAGSPTAAGSGSPTPQALLWQINAVKAPAGWSYSASNRIVAVLDTAIDGTHPDLAGVLLPAADFTGYSGGPNNVHGTIVTGMITAAAGAQMEPTVRGIKILPVTVCAPKGGVEPVCEWSDVADGIDWAIEQGASVINLSLGGPMHSSTLQTAVKKATANGVVVVAASGNDPTQTWTYPAAYPEVIAVGATTSSNVRADFSTYGAWLDIVAPGENVTSLYPGGMYAINASGTSFAAPMVSAAAALVRRLDPSLSPAQVRERLVSTARDLQSSGFDDFTGYGLLDIEALVKASKAAQPKLPTCPAGGVTHDQICRLYIAFFNRVPDKAGHNAWVAQRFAGVSIAEVAEAFAQSGEFRSKYGSISSGGFVDLVYQNVLGRPADSTGKSYWTSQLASGASRGSVMAAFSESAEYIAKTKTRPWRDWVTLQIERLYRAYFLRGPDAAGLSQWVAVRNFGVSLEAVSEQFARSAEFQNRYGSLSNHEFVYLVYGNVLGRTPDAAGYYHWLAELNGGTSRGAVMAAFSESAEFVQKTKTQP